ncbi:hypothetical protein BC834DRAFT_535806 [Gloeopeniophorella convolvens]|nr:hypothetical protein BC834DRAFT_535806 [Gloeopeniophorella convolvens]
MAPCPLPHESAKLKARAGVTRAEKTDSSSHSTPSSVLGAAIAVAVILAVCLVVALGALWRQRKRRHSEQRHERKAHPFLLGSPTPTATPSSSRTPASTPAPPPRRTPPRTSAPARGMRIRFSLPSLRSGRSSSTTSSGSRADPVLPHTPSGFNADDMLAPRRAPAPAPPPPTPAPTLPPTPTSATYLLPENGSRVVPRGRVRPLPPLPMQAVSVPLMLGTLTPPVLMPPPALRIAPNRRPPSTQVPPRTAPPQSPLPPTPPTPPPSEAAHRGKGVVRTGNKRVRSEKERERDREREAMPPPYTWHMYTTSLRW